jgi:hypothetical protein
MAYVTRGIGGKGLVLINDGYRYQRNWSSKQAISWRCFNQQCRAFVNVFDIEDPDARICVTRASQCLNCRGGWGG